MTAPTMPTTPRPGVVLGGRYQLAAEIGAGGAGAVYLARDRLLGRTVAVKVLHRALIADPKARARFEREARAVAALNHPAIVCVYDTATEDGLPYLVMEHVEGGTLADRLCRGPLPATTAIDVATKVAEALDHAHRHGVVHRDVKPANVLLHGDGAGVPDVKVADFGIARLAGEPAVTVAGVVMGTPFYMAPETARGEDVTASADLYSLGAMLHEMLTGAPPFADADPAVVVARHLHAPVPPLDAGVAPPTVVRLVAALLAKDPVSRPADAAAVARTLRRARAGMDGATIPVAAVTVPVLTPTAVMPVGPSVPRRPVRRRRLWAAVVLSSCLALVVAGYVLAWFAVGRWTP